MKEAEAARDGDTHDIVVSLQVELLCKEEEIKKAKKHLEELDMQYQEIENELNEE